ncbi:MAG TPA: methyltransferase domain-containing protein [Nitrosomonas sp.]|jgi:SAM-dependent methyltransferase|nr:methyltransferase domain-containing protein [Nitrosomonas sp.]
MTTHDEYFYYLMKRSFLGRFYRRHWLYPRISSFLAGKALDIGCGIGDMLAYRANTSGVDVNSFNVEYCRNMGLDAYLMQPDVLPFETAAFDSALLDNVLEHIADPEPLLCEIQRVLRPKGSLVVGVPGILGWQSDPDHKVEYDEYSLMECLSQQDFTQVAVFYAPLWRSLWLSRKVRQYCIYGVFVSDVT